MRNFKQFEIWKRGRTIVKEIYQMTTRLPDKERYGLISQLQRAAVSIPANISEGAGRRTEPDFQRFLYIAIASSYELETLVILCTDLNYITSDKANKLLNEIEVFQKQTRIFINKLDRKM